MEHMENMVMDMENMVMDMENMVMDMGTKVMVTMPMEHMAIMLLMRRP